jgi:hypothetical protein
MSRTLTAPTGCVACRQVRAHRERGQPARLQRQLPRRRVVIDGRERAREVVPEERAAVPHGPARMRRGVFVQRNLPISVRHANRYVQFAKWLDEDMPEDS